ncbi:MAG: protein phosphatase CheZ [Gammaproteobacteria bacterium]|nr:MAG: protein phosphatase CheZ [Gammaproteobacteria bacterium]
MDSSQKAQQLKAARALVIALEADEEKQAQIQLGILAQSQESDLFHQVGKLTRELHEALSNFNIDSRLIDLAETEIPNTRERLNYVITTTEEAAHKTLGFIDKSIPLTSKLKHITDEFDSSWHRFRMEQHSTDEFSAFEKDIESYLPEVKQHSDQIHNNLSEMMLAQGFQDLTGQVISQVISLVEEVESNLVRLVQVSSQHLEHKQKDSKPVDPIKAEGPQINAENKPNVVSNQDDVDDLLSSLGF